MFQELNKEELKQLEEAGVTAEHVDKCREHVQKLIKCSKLTELFSELEKIEDNTVRTLTSLSMGVNFGYAVYERNIQSMVGSIIGGDKQEDDDNSIRVDPNNGEIPHFGEFGKS